MTRRSHTRTVRRRVRIEEYEVEVIRFGSSNTNAYCSRCGAFVIAVSPTQVPVADLSQRLEAGEIHLVCSESERQIICGKSLGL